MAFSTERKTGVLVIPAGRPSRTGPRPPPDGARQYPKISSSDSFFTAPYFFNSSILTFFSDATTQ